MVVVDLRVWEWFGPLDVEYIQFMHHFCLVSEGGCLRLQCSSDCLDVVCIGVSFLRSIQLCVFWSLQFFVECMCDLQVCWHAFYICLHTVSFFLLSFHVGLVERIKP